MRPLKLLPLCILLLPTFSLAQITPSDQQRALENLNEQQQKQENLLKYMEREAERAAREKPKPQVEVPVVPEKDISGGPCFDVETITLSGATVLSEKEISRLTAPYVGTCMDIGTVNRLMREVTNFYMEQGYVTTRVAVPPQDLKDGSLELLVVEGKIEEIILNDNAFRDRMQVQTAFPGLVGKVLNLRGIEQGLDQINRLASSRATMELLPGEREGTSKVVLRNTPEKQTRARIGYDNSGQDATGRNKGSFALERDNLLGLGEYVSVSYNEDTADDSQQQKNEVLSGQFSLPFGWWTLSGQASRSEYVSTINGTNQRFQASGQTDSGNLTVNRVLHRGQDSKTSGSLGLTHKNTTSYIEDTETESGTQALTIARLSADHTHRALGSILYASAGYERGLKILGARQDADGLTDSDPRAQFDKYTLDASIYTPFAVKEQSLAYRLYASGQISPDPLFSSEQMNLGDRYTVRGFQQQSVAGDSGGYLRNEFLWNLPPWTENEAINNVTGGLQPYAALDAGMTRNKGGKTDTDPTGSAWLSGWALGLRNNSEWFNFDVAYAEAIKSPAFITEDGGQVYFNIGLELGF